MKLVLEKVVSGGQSGVDRAALDVAIAMEVPHGGWCPRGRRSEDGRIKDQYLLVESHSRDYAVRTEQNVADSDGTLIFHRGPLTGGTRLTRSLARRLDKPCLQIDLNGDIRLQIQPALDWLVAHQIRILNVAGPRESSSPGIHEAASDAFSKLLEDIANEGLTGKTAASPESTQ